MPVGGRQVEQRDFLAAQLGEEMAGRGDHLLAAQHQGGAGQERRPDLLGAGVEADRGELQQPLARFDAVGEPGVLGVVGELGVLHLDPFGFAGRARGVDHVGDVAELWAFGISLF